MASSDDLLSHSLSIMQELLLAQRRRDEPEPGVEARCVFVDGVDEHRHELRLVRRSPACGGPRPGASRRRFRAPGIPAIRPAWPRIHDRHGTSHPPADALGRVQRVDLAHGQAEVARHAIIILVQRRSWPSRCPGPAARGARASRSEPACAVEAFQPMLRGQGRRWPQTSLSRPKAPWRANRLRQALIRLLGALQQVHQGWYWLPETMNRR